MRYTKGDKRHIARAKKQEVYEEDDWGNVYLIGYRCPVCKRVFRSLDDLEVDHIHPRARGGLGNPSNLRLLCTKDNRKKGCTTKPLTTTATTNTSRTKTKTTKVRPKTRTSARVKTKTTRNPTKRP